MTGNALVEFVLFPLAAYAIGSTPFGVIIARLHGVDLRRAGSGNVGATNVARVIGRKWGYLCFVLDVAKGIAPVAAAGWWFHPAGGVIPSPAAQAGWLLVALAAVLGHVFSFYLRFRGGKGVATALGVVLGISPYFTAAGLAALALWVIVTLISRYVSVGSIAAAAAFVPLVAAFNWGRVGRLWPLMAFAAAVAALIVIRHISNIRRLLRGTESKIGIGRVEARGQDKSGQ
jgi:glycerol-3-phosphate acyltransferase PlsY